MNNFNGDNISFFLEEKNANLSNEFEIQKMMEEFNEEIDIENSNFVSCDDNDEFDLSYFYKKKFYNNDERFYDEYTIKDLLKICNYYNIEKDVKISKCKKQDIISTIIYFESLPENFEIVHTRHKMWAFITELLENSKMKKYIIWN